MIPVLMLVATVRLSADAVLLIGEPYGRFGSFNPTGHAAVYLTRICATSPTRVRRCQPGEVGVVVSRYQGIEGLDWIAIPLIPYLYAVDRADQAPEFADHALVMELRKAYRREHLRVLLPETATGHPRSRHWIQLVGASYDRKILAFTARTTPAQDDEVIDRLNGDENRSRYNLLFRNCADFARDVLAWYFPDL